MELFSEIYGAYFRTVERILSQERITQKEVQSIIQAEAFRDSLLFLPQKILPETPESWGLLRRHADGTTGRITKHEPPHYLTLLQKRWLKAKLNDPKMHLFLSDAELAALDAELADTAPLYPDGVFRYFDRFSDGDPYESAKYRRTFRKLLRAIRRREVVAVEYRSGKGSAVRGFFLPLKLEYSRKNDKFRLYCCRIRKKRAGGAGVLNVGRIVDLQSTGWEFPEREVPPDIFTRGRCSEPVQVRVYEERNGIERFLMEFASYEKHAERDEESRSCLVHLWYDTQEETELLIRLLGFGPVVEILSPPEFRAQAAKRTAKQYALLHNQQAGT